MRGKRLLFAASAAVAAAWATGAAAQDDPIKIGFLPGVVDPFYQVMELGVNKAAEDLGFEVVTQIPPTWGVEAQTPILDALVARGDLDYIITAPVEKDQMVGPLQAAVDAGIKVITVDTFLGDGDYVGRPGHLPARATSARTTSKAAASRRAGSPRRSAARARSTSTRPTRTSARSRAARWASPR